MLGTFWRSSSTAETSPLITARQRREESGIAAAPRQQTWSKRKIGTKEKRGTQQCVDTSAEIVLIGFKVISNFSLKDLHSKRRLGGHILHV